LELVANLADRLTVPVFAEGRIHTPEHARAAIDAGAYAVVVGTAITHPTTITSGSWTR
jgi:N-acylglucosamine-6-phosphate 2-epimerase